MCAYPALMYLVVFLSTALPICLCEFGCITATTAAFALGGCTILARVLFPVPAILGCVVSLLGILMPIMHARAPWASYRYYLPGDESHVEIRGVVVDDTVVGDEDLSWLGVSYRKRFRLEAIRLGRHASWQPCHGTVLISDYEQAMTFGEKIHVRGAIVLPDQRRLPGGMDYRVYLRAKGIHHLLHVVDIVSSRRDTSPGITALAALIGARTAVLKRIVRHIDGDERRILAAMTLGFRQALDPDQRHKYVRSGMIHLFAISGLHVGILFTLVIGVLTVAGVPFSLRYWSAPVCLLIYVLATGAAPSAIRAWLMLTIWSGARALNRPSIGINTVAAAALLLLVVNPFYVFQPGFQFSFLVVTALVLGWRRGSELIEMLGEKRLWRPRQPNAAQYVQGRMHRTFLISCFSMTAAWLGGLGLTAFYNNLFLPASIVVNMLVCTIAWLVLFLTVIKCAVSVVMPDAVERFVAQLLDCNLAFLNFLAEQSSGHDLVITTERPALWMIVLYYAILYAFVLMPRSLKVRSGATLALAACVTAAVVRYPLYEAPDVTLIQPRGQIVPLIVVSLPDTRSPTLINAGDKWMSRTLADWLRHRGVTAIDRVLVLDNTVRFAGGLERLAAELPIRSVVLMADDRRHVPQIERMAFEYGIDADVSVRMPQRRLANGTIRKQSSVASESYHVALHHMRAWHVTVDLVIPSAGPVAVSAVITDLVSGRRWGSEWRLEYMDQDRVESLRPD